MLYIHAENILCDVADRTAGDGRKNGIRLRSYQSFATVLDEDDVSTTGFFNLGTGCRIEIHILVKSLSVCFHDRMQGHCIVQTSLDVTGSVRSRTIEVRNTNNNGLSTTLEVRANGSNKNSEHVLVSRLNTDNGVVTEHVRADVESCSGTIRRYPVSIRCNNFLNSLQETLNREYRHLQTLTGISHTLCVQVRTESNNLAILSSVCLQTFETGLRVLQNTSTFVHGYGMILGQGTIIPLTIFIHGDVAIIGFHITKADIAPV